MTKVNPFEAYNRYPRSLFKKTSAPRCPHCGVGYRIHPRLDWDLYIHAMHTITCGKCELKYQFFYNLFLSFDTEGPQK